MFNGSPVKIAVGGVVAIGIITALFLPGRSTVGFTKAVGGSSQGVLNTVIKG